MNSKAPGMETEVEIVVQEQTSINILGTPFQDDIIHAVYTVKYPATSIENLSIFTKDELASL